MTLHKLSTSKGLLASKGTATPLGLRKTVPSEAEEDVPAEVPEARAAKEPPTQLTLVSDLEDGATLASGNEPPPPASLLPFALHRKRTEQSESWELVSPDLLERLSQEVDKDKADRAAPDRNPEQKPEPELQDVLVGAQDQPEPPAEDSPPRLGNPGADTGSESLAALGRAGKTAEIPREPSLDMAQAAQEAQAELSETPAARPIAPAGYPTWRAGAGPRPTAWESGSAHWLGWGVAAVFLVGGIAWWSFNNQASQPAARQGVETVEPTTIQSGTSPEPASPGETAVESESQAATPAVRETNPSTVPADTVPADTAAVMPPVADEMPSVPSSADLLVPSVDLVRVEENGDAVIAGRAAPNSELIILDNGTPIGSVKADAFGEWVFVPDRALPQGAHEFGLVLKAVQGKVTIPAESKPAPESEAPGAGPAGAPPSEAAPAPDAGAKTPTEDTSLLAPLPPRKPFEDPRESAGVAPIPERKPDFAAEPAQKSSLAGPPSADFVVQLASVKTRDGARQEWRKLQSQFPKALSGMNLNLHETKLSRQGTVIRVRTGPFPGFSAAVDFCAQIRTGSRQDCLVVRTGGRN